MLQVIVFRLMNWYLQESVIDTPLTYSIAHCTHWIMSGQYHSQEILNNESMKEEIQYGSVIAEREK